MNASEPDYYKILQVSPDAEQEVIEAAYRHLARKYHPDVNKSPHATERMRLINEAFETLGDPHKRTEYDARRGFAHRATQQPGETPRPKQRRVLLRGAFLSPWRVAAVAGVAGGIAAAVLLGTFFFVVADSPTPTEVATLTPATIDVRAIFESIRERYTGPPGFLNFGPWEYVELTGDTQPEALVRWNEGGNCGYFAEVWGYYGEQLTNLTPQTSAQLPNDLGCGAVEAKDLLDIGRPQITTTFRTFEGAGPVADTYERDIFCWNGAIFLHVATDYVDFDGSPVRPRLTIVDPSQCW